MKKLPIFDEPDNLKRYYTIGEVAELFEVTKSLIRFWEGEFDFLKPHKNSKGERRFTPQNLEQLQLIYELVKERGFTIEGARQEVRRHLKWQEEKVEMIKRLKRVRKGLKGILEALPDEA